MRSVYVFCISLYFLKLLYCSPFHFYFHASFKKITDSFFSVLPRPRMFTAATMDRKSWDTFAFLGRFPIHTVPTPPLIPQTMFDACIQNFVPVSTLYRVGGGRTARKFRKGCTLVRGNWEMTEKYEYCSTVPRTLVQDCELKQPRVSVNFEFRYESFKSFKCRFTLIVFVYNLLMEFSTNNRENYIRKILWTIKQENSD